MAKRPQQKLISFTNQDVDLIKIEQEVKDGWNIVSLTSNGNHYVGIMEKSTRSEEEGIFIPARKKIKILAGLK